MILDSLDKGLSNLSVNEKVNSVCSNFEEDYSLPLKERIICHIAESNVILKSQQKFEPDLTLLERKELTTQLIDKSASQFLYSPKCSMCLNPIWEDDVLKKCLLHRKCISRSTLAWNPVGCRECKKMGAASISVENVFALAVTKDVCQWIDNRFGKNLRREHLHYFAELPKDPEIDFYLLETQKILNEATSRTKIRNRRYGALCKLQSGSSYFSEEEMQKRDPLLYDELVGNNLTDEDKAGKVKSECNSFSELLLECMDKNITKSRKNYQQEIEDDTIEEFDEDEEEEDEDMETEIEATDEDTKELLKTEFTTSLYAHFLMGKDDAFDYSLVDNSEEYDMLEYQERDEEERYFDED